MPMSNKRQKESAMKISPELDTITDVVLAYKPKDKVKATKERAKRKAKRGKK